MQAVCFNTCSLRVFDRDAGLLQIDVIVRI